MAVAQLLLSMEPKYICHNQCTMGTSSPIVPKLSTEILLIPAILELYHKPPLKSTSEKASSKIVRKIVSALMSQSYRLLSDFFKVFTEFENHRKSRI